MPGYTLKLDVAGAQLVALRRVLSEDMERAKAEGAADAEFPTAVRRIHELLRPYVGANTLKLYLTDYELGALRTCLVAVIERAERAQATDLPAPRTDVRAVREVLDMFDDYRAALGMVKALIEAESNEA